MLKKMKIPLIVFSVMTFLFIIRDNFSFAKQLAKYFDDSAKSAGYVLLYNNTKDSVIYSKNSDKEISIGSINKIMTALVAMQYLSPDAEITVGDEVNSCLTDAASRSMIKNGEIFTFEQLLCAMLIPSGCDAAYTIAVNAARAAVNDNSIPISEAVDIFCDLMNRKARELNCKNTFYMNPDGQDSSGQTTTLNDTLIITKEALKSDIFRSIVKMPTISVTAKSGEKYTWENTNFLIRSDSRFFNKNVSGLKTGYTSDAGYSLVSKAEIEGEELICIVAKCSYEGLRYTISERLFAGGFAQFGKVWTQS